MELAAGGKRKSCRGERKAERKRERVAMAIWWLVGGLVNVWWSWLLKAKLKEEMVMVLVSCGGGRKKKKQKKKIYSGEMEDLAVATPIASEDLGS